MLACIEMTEGKVSSIDCSFEYTPEVFTIELPTTHEYGNGRLAGWFDLYC